MIYRKNALYRVEARNGESYTGFLVQQTSQVYHVFRSCYRVIHVLVGYTDYRSSTPSYKIEPRDLLATIVNPVLITPHSVIPEQELPYGAVHTGTWWKDIQVRHTPISQEIL